VATSKSKAFIDEAEALLAEIRGGVLVHLQDGVHPAHLKNPLDCARLLNAQVQDTEDEEAIAAADALEAWLMLLVAETEQISDTRTRSLLDQIAELEVALFAYKAKEQISVLDVGDLIDESFEILRVDKNALTAASLVRDKKKEDLEVDAELLEGFNEEAESLLRSIKLNLEVLSARPKDRDALWEIKERPHFQRSCGRCRPQEIVGSCTSNRRPTRSIIRKKRGLERPYR